MHRTAHSRNQNLNPKSYNLEARVQVTELSHYCKQFIKSKQFKRLAQRMDSSVQPVIRKICVKRNTDSGDQYSSGLYLSLRREYCK